jgi:TRAP-type C4-dicarboxylate transport system permease small subunit
MIQLLKQTRKLLCRLLEIALILAVLVLVLDVLWGVFTRYTMDKQAEWSEELARFLLIWVSLLGAAVAFGEKAHLGVDYFVGLLHPKSQRLLTVFGQILILIFSVSIFIYGGSRVVIDNLGQRTPALLWRMGHVYLALPIAGVFITFFIVEQLLETLLGKDEDKEEQ